MNRILIAAVTALAPAISFAGFVAAGPLEDGVSAAKSGDYATAIRLWRPLAERGEAKAQSLVGDSFALGQGVPQDYAAAVNWYRMAAGQGDTSAQSALAGTMSSRTCGSTWRLGAGTHLLQGSGILLRRK
jgi:TPR repeat protein